MSLLQWILIGCGGVLLLAGAVVLLIGILKKKSLLLWKILPGVVAVGGIALALTIWLGYQGELRMVQRENYVSWRLAELESYDESILAAEGAYTHMSNVQSTQLAVVAMALDGRYSQAASAAKRYQKVFDDATLKELEELCNTAETGEQVHTDLLMKLKEIGSSLSVSDGDKSKAESIVNLQMAVSLGDPSQSLDEDLLNLAGETDSLSQRVSAQAYMLQGNSRMTYEKLSSAANADASFPARAMLAQMKADGYNSESETQKAEAEAAQMQQQAQQKEQELSQLQTQLMDEASMTEEQILQLQQRIAQLEQEVDDLYEQIQSAPVRSAVDYILSSSPSAEEELAYNLLLAQLYFRSNDSLTAEDYLEKAFSMIAQDEAGGYLSAEMYRVIEAYDNSQRVTTDDTVYEDPSSQETQEETEETTNDADPQAAIQQLLYAMGKNVSNADVTCTKVTTDTEGNQTETQIQFSQFILEFLQDIRAGLHIGNVDTSQFPQISVSVNISRTKKDHEEYSKEDFSILEMEEEISDFELTVPSEGEKSSVCLVMDHSGSMEGGNLEQAKKAVSAFVQSGGSDLRMGLAIFDHTAQTLCPITGSTGAVQKAVDSVTADGNTNIALGLSQGMEALQGESGNRIIVLLSDGQDGSESAAMMDQVINQLVQQGIVVYAVGFDFADSAYLTRICEATGGKFLRSETSEGLGSIYQTIERFLSQDYVLTFTVNTDTQNYDRELRITMDGGVYDEKEYAVGVSSQRIQQESTLTAQSDYFQQIGGSYQTSKGPEAAQGYLEVIQQYQDQYGVGTTQTVKGTVQNTGLCLVRLLDFDGDGDDELLLGYNDADRKLEDLDDCTTYYEVWGWVGNQAQRLMYSESANYDEKHQETVEIVSIEGQLVFKRQQHQRDFIEYLSMQGTQFDTLFRADGNISRESEYCYIDGERVTPEEQKKALQQMEDQSQDTTVYEITQQASGASILEDTQKTIETLQQKVS